jgi:aconitate hydratase
MVSALAGEGIACFHASVEALDAVKGQKTASLPAPAQWADPVAISFAQGKLDAAWQAIGAERAWTHAGTARSAGKR